MTILPAGCQVTLDLTLSTWELSLRRSDGESEGYNVLSCGGQQSEQVHSSCVGLQTDATYVQAVPLGCTPEPMLTDPQGGLIAESFYKILIVFCDWARYTQAELIHSRWAMTAVAGILIPDVGPLPHCTIPLFCMCLSVHRANFLPL